MKRNFFKLISVLLIVVSLVFTSGYTASTNIKIPTNVSINGIEVSGMTKAQALVTLKAKFDAKLNSSYLLLKYGTVLWKLNYKTMTVAYDYTMAIDKALAVSRPATPDNNIPLTTSSSITTGSSITTPSAIVPVPRVNIGLTLTYNKNNINKFLNDIAKKIYIAPINATMKISTKTFKIIDGKNGYALDINSAIAKITKSILPKDKTKILLTNKVVQPRYTKNNLMDIKDKLGQFTTNFNASSISRVSNIRVAADNINNLVIMPNEIFSVNKTIGPRLESTGFKLAHVILNNRFVDGIGGGICQVSTTLYNAVLLANLKIVERSHHSIPSTYVKLGRDATISGDYKDLKFQNTTNHPIYITNSVEGSHITFSIYGKNDFPNRKIEIKTTVLSSKKPTTSYVNDPTLPKGKVVVDIIPEPAYTVQSFREIYEKGRLVSTENLFLDKYPLINGVKKVGTKQN